MNQKQSIPDAAVEWEVTRVKLDVEHTTLYANGRQQVKVIVYVEAMLNGLAVKLTQREKDSIRLIDYQHGEMQIPLEAADGSLRSYQGWSSQRQFRGYLYHPGTQSSKRSTTPAPDVGGDYVELYLSATPEALSGRLAVGFIVTGDNGVAYRSDGWVIDPGMEPVKGGDNIDSGGDQKVTATHPPAYPVSDFRLDRQSGTNSGGAPDAGIFNDTVTLSIVHAGRTVDVLDMTCTPAGMIHWKDDDHDAQDPCYTGYAPPGETSVHWNDEVPTGGQPQPMLGRPVDNKGVILLCGRADIRRGDHLNPPRGPIEVNLVDAYGSTQTCTLGFVKEERDVLEIS